MINYKLNKPSLRNYGCIALAFAAMPTHRAEDFREAVESHECEYGPVPYSDYTELHSFCYHAAKGLDDASRSADGVLEGANPYDSQDVRHRAWSAQVSRNQALARVIPF